MQAIAILTLLVQTAAQPPTSVGIFNINIVGADAGLQQTSIDALATAVSAVGGWKVVSRNELSAMMGAERIKDLVGCDDMSCLAEIGAAAGVEKLITGSVSQVENALVVSLQLVNTKFATVENRLTLSWEGSPTKLPDVLGASAEQLVIPVKDRKPGRLRLTGVPTSAVVVVDGEPRGTGPVYLEGLAVGVHSLKVEADEFTPHLEPFVIRNGGETRLEVRLVERAELPFYTKWWFWTAAGAAVAGGIAGGVLLTKGGAGSNGSNDTGESGFAITSSPP